MSKVINVPETHTGLNDKLLITARVLEKAWNLLFSNFNMTERTYEILIHVHTGEKTTAELAAILQSSLANITHKTKLLESQGYLKRVVDGKDKRVWYFSLTPDGKQALKTMRYLYEKATEKLYADFSGQEKKRVLEFLNAIEAHLKAIIENKEQIKTFIASQTKMKSKF